MVRKYLSLKEIVNRENINKKYEDIRNGDIYQLIFNEYKMLELRLVYSYLNDLGWDIKDMYYLEQLFELEFVEVK